MSLKSARELNNPNNVEFECEGRTLHRDGHITFEGRKVKDRWLVDADGCVCLYQANMRPMSVPGQVQAAYAKAVMKKLVTEIILGEA